MRRAFDNSPLGIEECLGDEEVLKKDAVDRGINLNSLRSYDLFPRDILSSVEKEIRNCSRQPIVAIHRYYYPAKENGTTGRLVGELNEILYLGVLRQNSFFPKWSVLEESCIEGISLFLENVDSCHSLDLNLNNRNFESCRGFSLDRFESPFNLLYLMNKPPVLEVESEKVDFASSEKRTFFVNPDGKPRLEFYVGTEKSASFLEETLHPWEYIRLEDIKIILPESPEMTAKIEKDQIHTVLSVMNASADYSRIVDQVDRRIAFTQGEMAMVAGNGFELNDSVTRGIKHVDNIEIAKDNLEVSLKSAFFKGYHQKGRIINYNLVKGVAQEVDVKEFLAYAFQTFPEFMPEDYLTVKQT